MIRLTQKHQKPYEPNEPLTTLTLPWDQRTKSRLRVVLDNGQEAGLFLERGTVLRGGDRIASDDGEVVEIRAAAEPLSEVGCEDALLMARACYHLGNRHTMLEITPQQIHYLSDPVLDDMVRGLGLTVHPIEAPFEPELGAYAGHSHGHAHG